MAVVGLLAASVAAAPASDTSLRVPGTALRFGMSQAQVQQVIRTQSSLGVVPPAFTPGGPSPAAPAAPAPPAAPAAPGAAPPVRVRFFGLDGQAALEFQDGLLARAVVKVANPSPHDIDYIEDDLARQGFHRRCDSREGLNRRCDWTARAHVRLTTSEASLEAILEPIAVPPRPAPARATVAALPLPTAAALPETLQLSFHDPGPPAESAPASPAPDSLPWPLVLSSCQPVRPEIARQSGVFGRVLVEATVDSSGTVVAARIARGVPMLDAAALECARQYRFARYRWRGRVHPFRLAIPIRFTL